MIGRNSRGTLFYRVSRGKECKLILTDFLDRNLIYIIVIELDETRVNELRWEWISYHQLENHLIKNTMDSFVYKYKSEREDNTNQSSFLNLLILPFSHFCKRRHCNYLSNIWGVSDTQSHSHQHS